MNDERRPRTESGADDYRQGQGSSRGRRIPESGPVVNVLDLLDHVRPAQRGWIAICPGHEDRRPSLSIAEGDDGRVLLNCFSGCSIESIVGAIGLELRDLFLPRDPVPTQRWRALRPKPHPIPQSIAEVLLSSSEFAERWEVAKTLAPLEPRQTRADVLASWDWLADCVDIPATLHLASLVRGVAMFRYCSAKSGGDPAAVARAVRRLIRNLERAADRTRGAA